MDRPNIGTYQIKIKAVHRYEVVDSSGAVNAAGKKFHFIGAGGVGMSGLAQLLTKNCGVVSGSDQIQSAVTDRLCEMGADIKIGHKADNLNSEADAVVISAAIKEDNPELKQARKRGIKIYKYAQMLGILCNRYEGIAVAGTHGKSTTGGWLVKCEFRAKNLLGAYVRDSKWFVIQHGHVVDVRESPQSQSDTKREKQLDVQKRYEEEQFALLSKVKQDQVVYMKKWLEEDAKPEDIGKLNKMQKQLIEEVALLRRIAQPLMEEYTRMMLQRE